MTPAQLDALTREHNRMTGATKGSGQPEPGTVADLLAFKNMRTVS